MRAYSTAVAARALQVDRRWLDSIVVQHRIEGVKRDRQGVSRTFDPTAVLTIAVAVALIDALDMPVASALRLATALLRESGQHAPVPGVTLHVDVIALEQTVSARLVEAVEAHPLPRRGRPPLTR